MNTHIVFKSFDQIKSNDSQYVSTVSDGIITDILVEEGQYIEDGMPIVRLTNGNEDIELIELKKQLEIENNKIKILDKYKKSLDEKKNYLLNSGIEQEFYGYVEYYLLSLRSEKSNENNNAEILTKKSN